MQGQTNVANLFGSVKSDRPLTDAVLHTNYTSASLYFDRGSSNFTGINMPN